MVVLQISLRRTTKRSATESSVGRVCQRLETLRSLAYLDSSSIPPLPESYLYGLVDVKLTANYYTSYLLGKVYAHGVWFYFPIAFPDQIDCRCPRVILLVSVSWPLAA